MNIVSLKGQRHEMDIFFKGLNILIITFCVCAESFQGLSYTIMHFLFAFLKLLTNIENAYWNPLKNSLLCDRSMFSSAELFIIISLQNNIHLVTQSQ